MTLYEMTVNAQYLYQLLEDGEIDDQVVNDSLESMCVTDKLEDYCKVIRQFEADVEAYKAEKLRFEQKQKKAEKAIERLEKAVLGYMSVVEKDKERCGLFEIKVNNSKGVRIVDEARISSEYLIEQPLKIDKAAIRKVLMNGGTVAGAELQQNQTINIK